MNKTTTLSIGAFFILISIAFTIWQQLDKQKERSQKQQQYLSAQAAIVTRMPERITRYGVQQARYTITFKDKSGETITASNCKLGGTYQEGDTLVIFYNPADPSNEIIAHK